MHSSADRTKRHVDSNNQVHDLDNVAINVKSHRLLHQLMHENPDLEKIMQYSKTEIESLLGVRAWVMDELEGNENALSFYQGERNDRTAFKTLKWRDFAAIRLLDYIDHAGMTYKDKKPAGRVSSK